MSRGVWPAECMYYWLLRVSCMCGRAAPRIAARVARELQREPRLSVAFHFLVALVAGSMRKAAFEKIARSAVVSAGAIASRDAPRWPHAHTQTAAASGILSIDRAQNARVVIANRPPLLPRILCSTTRARRYPPSTPSGSAKAARRSVRARSRRIGASLTVMDIRSLRPRAPIRAPPRS